MKILFWIGYTSYTWDGNTKTGLGGTEIAVINIAEGLARYGYEVTVSGTVNNSTINGVEWIDINNYIQKMLSNTMPLKSFGCIIQIIMIITKVVV